MEKIIGGETYYVTQITLLRLCIRHFSPVLPPQNGMANAQEQPYRLHLDPQLAGLYLDVPVRVATSLCLYPVKYLRYLGYCILGIGGTIATDNFDGDVLLDDDVINAGPYYFVRDGQAGVLEHAVDPEALTYSHASQTTNTHENFRDLLETRDQYCVFTAMVAECCRGAHIVPFSKGDPWLRQIVESRIPEDGEVVSDLTTINEIRNGMLVSNNLHPLVDKKKLAVLKTPNLILACSDVPPPSNATQILPDGVKYSTNPRYTLQWLNGDSYIQSLYPNNKDAAFKEFVRKTTLPSPLLLHYNYGVAALKWWGKGPEYLITARTRPAPPIPAAMGPSKSKHDRSVRTKKLEDARSPGGLQGDAGTGGSKAIEDIDERREEDAERLVLNFYVNTPTARLRRAQEKAEKRDSITEWQKGLLTA
ncbi:hypothetical protein MVEN_01574900 [Mycena venus]|uniref:HNH nuclease domain-containing protein n=1 Tax=Mycena venus TaxID=2733690 RepID=A0A8H6XSC6_9AGAR|nr:hypothetical protein MVEN_01574900 [Mycena venus]